jgi:nucleotide-binding universal stress UspA family protein
MLNVVVPVDGSEGSMKAIDHLVDNRAWYARPTRIHVMNVQPPLPDDVTRFIARDDVRNFHLEQGHKAVEQARNRLAAAGMDHELYIGVGEPSATIAEYVRRHSADLLVLGTRGLGAVAGMLLGSSAAKIVRECPVPVMLVR